MKIDTRERDWLIKLAKAYRKQSEILVVDEAGFDLDPSRQSIYQMGRSASVPLRTWIGVLISLGMSAFGIRMVAAAILDPEPTSKLGLLISSGTLLVFCGGFNAMRLLTNVKPPSVGVTKTGIRISWK